MLVSQKSTVEESAEKKLDFVIIGAQKCATTALYSYLGEHPDIAMPALKEAPFFVYDDNGEDSWQEFCDTHYMGQSTDRVWGKASPQYMTGMNVPERIYRHSASIKMIALIRDPIHRAWSHYIMDKRRETETRDFEEIVDSLLNPEQLEWARKQPAPLHTLGYESESDYYLVWSEYGRILKEYHRQFSSEQLLVLQVDDLRSDPQGTLNSVLSFLELDEFTPSNLGKVVHKGGSQRILTDSGKKRLLGLWPIRSMWNCVSDDRKQRLRYWYDQFNVKSGKDHMTLSASTERRLRAHFAKDLEILNEVFGIQPVWSERYSDA